MNTKPVVKLEGEDGNAYAILARVNKALKRAGLNAEAKEFMAEATARDYNSLRATAGKYVEII